MFNLQFDLTVLGLRRDFFLRSTPHVAFGFELESTEGFSSSLTNLPARPTFTNSTAIAVPLMPHPEQLGGVLLTVPGPDPIEKLDTAMSSNPGIVEATEDSTLLSFKR
jgi:hypothetical protein